MPTYDVECSGCGHSDTAAMKLNELAQWDARAVCPMCMANALKFRRVIRQAPTRFGVSQTTKHQLAAKKAEFIRSGKRDDMRHAAIKRTNKDELSAGLESVKKGEFEGF